MDSDRRPASPSETLRLVTVVMPMRNEAAHVEACLASLLAQDYPHLEIVVVDGMSQDGSAALVDRVAARDARVRLIENPKRIIPAALNRGIRAASGTYIVRTDCKSRYQPDYVSTCVHYLERDLAVNVGGPCVSQPGARTTMARAIAAISGHPIVMGGSRYRSNMTAEEYTDGVTYGAWPRAIFERIGFFNEELVRGEDNEFNGRILRAGGRILKTPRIVVNYICRPTLRQFLRQTFDNGFWHFLTMAANPHGVRMRHFAPAGWVGWVLGFASLALVDLELAWPLAAGVSIYSLMLLLIAVQLGRMHGLAVAALVPLVVCLFHFVYGLATWAGVFRFGGDPAAIRRARTASLVDPSVSREP